MAPLWSVSCVNRLKHQYTLIEQSANCKVGRDVSSILLADGVVGRQKQRTKFWSKFKQNMLN